MSTAVAKPPVARQPLTAETGLVARPLTLADLVAGALAEQQELTAVERFSQWHEDHDAAPVQAKHYRSLLPARSPDLGEQYAFDVDLDACSGCKSCVVACHALNGLDEHESWRDVGLLTPRDPAAPAALQYVTTACHHCLEPACAIGCPVNAYEKDPTTGIVRHLDDQCFGCTYCTLACPYEVPKYHAGKGIVRKCDMCTDRLADGEAPACVQSCPNEAIRITVVAADEVRTGAQHGSLVPGAVDSSFTLPTTRFRSTSRDLSRLRPADQGHNEPQHAHAALVVMLVLTQMAVGILGAVGIWIAVVGGVPTGESLQFLRLTTTAAALAAIAGVAAATFHLGRPQYAFRAVLGITHSWLSREIVAFGVFMPMAVAAAVLAWTSSRWPALGQFQTPTLMAAAATGAVAVWCSIRIYQFTRRPFWVGANCSAKFAQTVVVLGAAFAWFASAWSDLPAAQARAAAVALAFATVVKLAFETGQLRAVSFTSATSVASSARLLRGPLRNRTVARFALGVMGGVVLPLAAVLLGSAAHAPVATLALLSCFAGELWERTLFFQAVVPLKMPGGLPT